MGDSTSASLSTASNEPGYALGAALIAILVALLVACTFIAPPAAHLNVGLGTVLLGIYLMAWGVMFLASYYFSYKTFFVRALIWVCEHFSYPAGRGMAFFYFALCFIGGGIIMLKGLGHV